MEKRPYNIFFDLHTVSGIVISVLLYVIFFTGSFSFFRDEIVNWERNEPVDVKKKINVNIDQALDSLQKQYDLFGRDVTFARGYDERRMMVNVSDSKDSLNKKAGDFFYLDPISFKTYSYEESYSLGEFLYRLHFFAQIPYPAGYFISGFTALFFFFAILTGILVHWKKLISNFYLFRPWAKLKTIWTDAHTVLGTIGLPFQVVYAVTGAFFMINIVLLIPSVPFLYNGEEDQIYKDLEYVHAEYDFKNERSHDTASINSYVLEGEKMWADFSITEVNLHNYGDANMHISVEGELQNATKFTAPGGITWHASTNEIVHVKNPHNNTTYLDGVKNILYRLHFGDYGGYWLRSISFALGLISCFVIITGILIWIEARNKTNIPEKRKRFNETVGHIYLAICLTLYPVTALAFIFVKVLPQDFDAMRMTTLYTFYFCTWLVLSILFTLKKDNYFTNKYTLLAGGLLGLLVPVINGVTTGNWIWLVKPDLFVVDLLWIFISLLSLFTVRRLKKRDHTERVQPLAIRHPHIKSHPERLHSD